ncbi:TRAP transporter solute receptor, TAXI family [Desulfoluna spongiiphila]|uniref:TRAP transporter solute receptor, TAXI family n=2 Tax=Desulfoluna spongiiphila TaxID=419481 RepID=A0A1G5GIG1_9BACT|nr:TRAP transporter solute receptor, TAXI family [Desulfoluna spongiiphila]
MKVTMTPRFISRCSLLLLILLVVSFSASDSDARRSRKSSYKRSSKSWSKPASPSKKVWGQRDGGGIFGKTKKSSGYSKPGTKKKATATNTPKKTSASGYSKPGSTSTPKKKFAGTSSFDKKNATAMKKKKAAASYAAYQKETGKFKQKNAATKPSSYASSPIYRKTKKYSDFDYRTHYQRRDNYYRGRGWTPPGYAYRARSRFGMWDAMAWWMVLDTLGSRNSYAMAYHHADDPGYREWRQEADRMARDDAVLKAKLTELDAKVATLEGTPVQPDYLPDGMPPEVALSAEAMAKKTVDKPVFTLATASPGGNYTAFGNLLKQGAPTVDVNIRTTAGSMENLRLLATQEVDAAIVQSDAFEVFRRTSPKTPLAASEQVALYPEVVQMIANRKSGIQTVQDIEPDGEHILYIGPRGSGTAMTWEGLCLQDDGYRKIRTRNASYEEALDQVINNPNAVMMFVSGLNSSLLAKAEAVARNTKKIRLVQVDDWDFNDARDHNWNRIYQFVNIPSKTYPGLQKGFILGSDVESIAVSAVLVVRTDWARQYGPEAMDALSYAIMESKPVIQRRTNGLTR